MTLILLPRLPLDDQLDLFHLFTLGGTGPLPPIVLPHVPFEFPAVGVEPVAHLAGVGQVGSRGRCLTTPPSTTSVRDRLCADLMVNNTSSSGDKVTLHWYSADWKSDKSSLSKESTLLSCPFE